MRHHHPSRNDSQRRRFRVAAALLLGLIILCTAAYALTVVWTRTVNGSADGDDRGQDLALAPNGDLYVVGNKTVTGQESDIWIRKYGADGSTKWTRTVAGPASFFDSANAAAVDSAGNLYVVGYIFTAVESDNIWIRKYSSSGAKLWTRTVNGAANGSDRAHGAALDGAGNLYVVGRINVSSGGNNIWIRKYNSAGAKLWTRTVNGPASLSDEASGAAVDSVGNLYVVGYVWVTGEDLNIWIRKYSSAGTKQWTRTIDGRASGRDFANDIAVDSAGNVVVVGVIDTSDEARNIWIRKYSSSGIKRWTRTANGSADGGDIGSGATVDANDAVYVIGLKVLTAGFTAWIRKYSSSGKKRWTETYAGPDSSAGGEAIAINTTNRVYVAGYVLKSGQSNDIWVRKFRQ